MASRSIVKDAYLNSMGWVDAVLLDGGDELMLIDAGFEQGAARLPRHRRTWPTVNRFPKTSSLEDA